MTWMKNYNVEFNGFYGMTPVAMDETQHDKTSMGLTQA